jgi:hypothetical protein
MDQFDWGDSDETDDEFLSRTNELLKRTPLVEKMINIWNFKIKNIQWNKALHNPMIAYLGYPKNNTILCSISFKNSKQSHLSFIIQFSPDIKRVFASYEHNFVEFDVASEKILDFISTIINQHINGTYKECDDDNKPMPSWVK